MLSFRCHAATDITGYGLLGHACEMAEASQVTFRFHARSIPFIAEAYPLAEAHVLPGLVAKTWRLLEPKISISSAVPLPLRSILLDPQTSGGLLIAVHPEDREPLLENLISRGVEAVLVGEVETAQDIRILVE